MPAGRLFVLSYAAGSLVAGGGILRADVLISNYGSSVGPGTLLGTGTSTVYKALGFVAATKSYTLDSVKLTMNFGAGGTGQVSIWQGAGAPQQHVANLNGPPQTGSGDFVFTPAGTLVLIQGTTYWVYVASVPNPTGGFSWDGTSPQTVPAGAATFVGSIFNGSASPYYNRIDVRGTPVGGECYANCDGSTGVPVLTGNDFQCFADLFGAGDTRANCDGSTGTPVLTANDFQCFADRFIAGCS